MGSSLVDWDMRSDRNAASDQDGGVESLVDWDMRSDRNLTQAQELGEGSLVDWDMRSGRKCKSHISSYLERSVIAS